MKIAIVGDVHGAPLARKVDEIKDETNFDKLVVLGDLDRAHLAHELMDILDTEDTIAVVGNHDYSHINGETIYSGTMRKQSINSPQMWKEWANDPEATNFIRTGFERGYFGNSGILGKRVSTDLTPEQKIIVIHGAYAGDQHSSSGNS
ncbi:metallophosphoesterase, partial [Candidatus Woesearchaeota archaeon]|nr:metallophosphoesterase [Candidatus Woesearchaeota archaeon]